jgi:hypothetical protein
MSGRDAVACRDETLTLVGTNGTDTDRDEDLAPGTADARGDG